MHGEQDRAGGGSVRGYGGGSPRDGWAGAMPDANELAAGRADWKGPSLTRPGDGWDGELGRDKGPGGGSERAPTESEGKGGVEDRRNLKACGSCGYWMVPGVRDRGDSMELDRFAGVSKAA